MTSASPLTTTLQALIDEEQARTANAHDRLGTFVPLCQSAIALLNTFIESVGRDHFLAAALMLSINKSATLSFLAYVRGHIAQAEFNSRQTIEFCALAAYLAAHPEEDVTKPDDDGTGGFKPPKDISVKAYKWLNKEHPHHSALLKDMKDQINSSASHASLYLTHFTFDWESGGYDEDQFRGSFFDNTDEDVSRLYLMSLAHLILIVVDTMRLVSKQHGGLVLRRGVDNDLAKLDHAINELRALLAKRMGLQSTGC
jgi:hypothetical protein